jgi:hypothetical protein
MVIRDGASEVQTIRKGGVAVLPEKSYRPASSRYSIVMVM